MSATTLCDRCAKEWPEEETQTCEACGGVFCDDCHALHDCNQHADTRTP